MKPKYVIHFTGIFQEGYVKFVLLDKTGTIPFQNQKEVLDFATKFRFKWMADLFCFMQDRISRFNYDLKTFKVQKI